MYKDMYKYLVETVNLTKADAKRVMFDARIHGWTDEETVRFAKSLLISELRKETNNGLQQ